MTLLYLRHCEWCGCDATQVALEQGPDDGTGIPLWACADAYTCVNRRDRPVDMPVDEMLRRSGYTPLPGLEI